MKPPHALIAGAGIGGLCAALCLARAGWQVTIFDKTPVLEEAGAGLQLSPNASSILRDLGVLALLGAAALEPRQILIRRARDGATLAALPLEDADRRWGAPYLLAHRADLQRALLDKIAQDANISLKLGATIASFAASQDQVAVGVKAGPVTLKFTGDCLIGADGLHSFVRSRLVANPADAPKFANRTAWRALVPVKSVSPGMRQQETMLWLGRKAHLVHYPLRGGEIVNVVAIVEDHFRVSESQDFWSSPGDAEFVKARFSAWDGAARDLIAAAPQWRKWPLFDRDPLPSWSAGRVALLGDAAHPMLPFLAQGAAQAIEDAHALGVALVPGTDVERALAAYQRARQARAARVQAESRRQSSIYHLSGPAALARDLAIRFSGPQRLLGRYDWLYSTVAKAQAV